MEEFKNNLIKVTNESNLPIEAIYFVVKDFYRDVESAMSEYKARIEAEKAAEKETEDEIKETE
jgi:hypothetical protein